MEWPELANALHGLGAGARVAEIGTGHGALFAYLLELLRVSRQWRLATVDIAPEPVAAALHRIGDLPKRYRSRVTAIQRDATELARDPAFHGRFSIVCSSALLSALPLAKPWAAGEILRACRDLLCPGGMLFIEDYLPLPPARPLQPSTPLPSAGQPAGSPAGAGRPGPTVAPEVARALWRLDKAVAELAGLAHYVEVPPEWVASRLGELGFGEVRVSMDERQEMRGGEELAAYLRLPAERPGALDPSLWLALDRYRRDLLALAASEGLAQWSGSYRVSARLPVRASCAP